MQSADRKPIKEGSPAKKPCANTGFTRTADEKSAAEKINTTGRADAVISAGPVPLSLIPQTLSSEIHAHGGAISEITLRRTGQDGTFLLFLHVPVLIH